MTDTGQTGRLLEQVADAIDGTPLPMDFGRPEARNALRAVATGLEQDYGHRHNAPLFSQLFREAADHA